MSAVGTRAFTPALGGLAATKAISATSTAAATQLAVSPCINVRVYNAGTGLVFIAFGPSTVAPALSTAVPVASGASVILGTSRQSYVGTICPTGATATVYVTSGEGGL